MFVERFEDMSPTGRLRIMRQDDGDMIVVVIEGDGASNAVEFCTPMSGGGQSCRTHNALRVLMVAMAQDELERRQLRRFSDNREARTQSENDDQLQKLVDNEKAIIAANAEMKALGWGV